MQYKVLRPLINAPVGTILKFSGKGSLYNCVQGHIIIDSKIQDAINQHFIEPYTPEPKHWRAEVGNPYYWIDSHKVIIYTIDNNTVHDSLRYDQNNYYRTEATAELVAKAQKLMFEWLHDTESSKIKHVTVCGLTLNLLEAMDEARKAVLRDDKE